MRKVAVLFTALAVLAGAAPAAADNYTVLAGPTGFFPQPHGLPKAAELQQFYPSRLEIHAGDTVTFRTREGHTVTFLGPRKPSQFHYVVPGPTDGAYEGIFDIAGNLFWFEGKRKFVYNTGPFVNPAGSTTIVGHGFHNRLIFGRGGGDFTRPEVTFTFPKPGSYPYICLFHWPVMRGTIIVRPAGAALPSEAATQARVAAQLTAEVEAAKWAERHTSVPPSTVIAGVTYKGVDLIQYFPRTLTVRAGTTVAFVNRSLVEPHNEVFGNDRAWIKAFLRSIDQYPNGQVGPEQVYGTEPPPRVVHNGSNHGNGLLVTRVTGTPLFLPAPKTDRVTFTKPGKYRFYCEIHGPEMSGVIVVRR